MEHSTSLTRILGVLLLFSGLAVFAPLHAASLYKWTDEEGNVHYSQTPPEKQQAEKMHVKDSPASAQQPPAAQEEDAEADGMPEGAGQDPAVVEAKQRNCEIARSNLEVYKSSEKIQQPDGSVITLSDEMREMKVKEAQAMVDANCK